MEADSRALESAVIKSDGRFREQVEALTKEGAETELTRLRNDLRVAHRSGDQVRMGRSLLQIAMILRGQRQYSTAVPFLEEARAVLLSLNDSIGLATVFSELALCNRELQRNALALEYAHNAVNLLQQTGRTVDLAWVYDNIAVIHLNLFQRHESLTYMKKARAIFLEVGNRNGLLDNSSNLASLYGEMGFYKEASQYCREALRLATELKNKQAMAWAMLWLGRIEREQCKFDSSETLLRKARTIFYELGLKDRVGLCLLHEAAVKRDKARDDEAAALNKRASQLFTPLRNRDGVAWSLFQMGQVYLDRGQLIRAWQTLRESLNLHTDVANRKGIGWAENDLGKTYLELNDLSHARECFIKAQVIADQIDDISLKTELNRTLASLHFEEGALGRSEVMLSEGLAMARKINNRDAQVEALLERARRQILMRELDDARTTVDEARAIAQDNSLKRLIPTIGLYVGEILLLGNDATGAARTWEEVLKLATDLHQRRPRAEAMLGLIQALGLKSPALKSMLSQIAKDLKQYNSRKLRVKFLAVRGLHEAAMQGEIDSRYFSQGASALETAGLTVFELQMLRLYAEAHRRADETREVEHYEKRIKTLLDKGPADLRSIPAPKDILDTLPVSLVI